MVTSENVPRIRGRPSKEFIAKYGGPKAKSQEPTYEQKLKWCAADRAQYLREAQKAKDNGDRRDAAFYRGLVKLSTYEATYGKGAPQLEKRCEKLLAKVGRDYP